VGSAVTKFRVGDIGGVGCMVNSCGTCENCLADREQNCLKEATFTYNSPDPATGGQTFGGYSDKIVVPEHFLIRIPPGVDLAATAPLLCAGITTFSLMQHWQLARRQRVGVIGLGGSSCCLEYCTANFLVVPVLAGMNEADFVNCHNKTITL
jgi:uncharacterized zinc-type alcohol dehydrogenase-like protein